jgi:hypothetical protein
LGLALGAQAQSKIIDIIEMSFILMYKVVGLFLFISLLLMVWGGFHLILMVWLKVAIITGYGGCRVWVFAAFWGDTIPTGLSFQLY